MNKDLQLWQFVAERLAQNESVTLLVVAESSGSSPGRQGFKMAVAEDELYGSIGGGVMEVSLVELAKGKSEKEKAERKKAKGKKESDIGDVQTELIEQVHRKNSQDTSGMICSGEQTVIIISLNSTHLSQVNEIILALQNQNHLSLQLTNNEFQISSSSPTDSKIRFERRNETDFRYEERLGFKNQLFIVGGGHCALALSELMSKMDFNISLFDDRPDLNTLDKNEFVQEKIVVDRYEDIGTYISSGQNKYVVVMTLGYKFDGIVIRKLAEKEFKYFGVLGSKAKMSVLLRELENEGISRRKLERIRTPIGLGINSRTPEEIAVSIAAEIIAVKNAKG